jgi:hypothetical protein
MAGAESVLDAAARRLNEALERLERRLAEVRARDPAADLFESDVPRGDDVAAAALQSALERERARVRALEAAASDASAALGRAAAEIRTVMAGERLDEEA